MLTIITEGAAMQRKRAPLSGRWRREFGRIGSVTSSRAMPDNEGIGTGQ